MKTVLAVALLTIASTATGCATINRGPLGARQSCEDITLPVYFQEKSDVLTPPAHQALVLAAARAKACRVTGIEVLGLSDIRDASPELSLLRAEMVSRALTAQGLEVPRADAADAARATRDGRTQPMQRRTEVVIHLER